MLSSHLYLGLPCDLFVRGFHLNIFLTVLVSGILCTWPNQLSLLSYGPYKYYAVLLWCYVILSSYMIYIYIYLLTAFGLPPGGSSTIHIAAVYIKTYSLCEGLNFGTVVRRVWVLTLASRGSILSHRSCGQYLDKVYHTNYTLQLVPVKHTLYSITPYPTGVIWRFRREVYESCALQGYYAASSGRFVTCRSRNVGEKLPLLSA